MFYSKFVSHENVQDLSPLVGQSLIFRLMNCYIQIKECKVIYDFSNANCICLDTWLNSIDWCCLFNDVSGDEICGIGLCVLSSEIVIFSCRPKTP